MQKLFILIAAICLFSCSNQSVITDGKPRLKGTYSTSVKGIEGASIQLEFMPNNKFEYIQAEGLTTYKTSGEYELREKLVLLTSTLSGISKNGRVFEDFTNEPITLLTFVNISGMPIEHLRVKVDNNYFYTDSIGRVLVPNRIKVLQASFYNDYSFYYINNKGANYFKVTLFPNDNSELFFSNETLRIRKNSLINNLGIVLKEKN
jgi:hypothetical protein